LFIDGFVSRAQMFQISTLFFLMTITGMTLDRVVVRLTKSASSPGVAFVALSRVRHPDHLMLDGSFPDMATIMKQSDTASFKARIRWERAMRVRFSRTLRKFMRDSAVYSAPHIWVPSDDRAADVLLEVCRQSPCELDQTVLERAALLDASASLSTYTRIWSRLQQFPHMFEIAAAKGTLT
jgi:hypothetical protein